MPAPPQGGVTFDRLAISGCHKVWTPVWRFPWPRFRSRPSGGGAA